MSSEKAQIIEQIKKIDDIFSYENKNNRNKKVSVIQVQRNRNCHLHSPHQSNYNEKQTKLRNRNSIGSIRELLPKSQHYASMPKLNVGGHNLTLNLRRDSVASIRSTSGKPMDASEKLFKGIEHPSAFPSYLRSSTTSLVSRKDSENYQRKKHSDYFDSRTLFSNETAQLNSKRHSIHSISGAFSMPTAKTIQRDHVTPVSILKKETSPNPFNNSMNNNNSNSHYNDERKPNDELLDDSCFKSFDKLHNRRLSFGSNSRKNSAESTIDWGRRISIDSLDSRRSSHVVSEKIVNPEPEVICTRFWPNWYFNLLVMMVIVSSPFSTNIN
jgi:hypothetical protein